MKNKPQMYFSIDIEADGPIPGINSMLSLGCAAFNEKGELVATFQQNLEAYPGAVQDSSTMEWWDRQPKEVYEKARLDARDPKDVMLNFADWVDYTSEECKPVCVAFPAGFDFTFVYWYLMRYLNRSPFSFTCLDIKTMAAAVLNIPFSKATKKNFPSGWFENKHPHTHVAVDDAIEQGYMFMRILEDLRKLHGEGDQD